MVPSPLTPTWIVVRTGLRGTPTPAVADTVGLGAALRLTVRYDEADDYPRVQVAILEQALDETLDSTLHPCFRCPQRDSNPCCHLERVVTWAASRWGRRPTVLPGLGGTAHPEDRLPSDHSQ